MLTDETFKNIAEHCSAFHARDSHSSQNKAGDSDVTCLNCKHFVDNNHCELDLVDPIVENHNF